MTPSAAGSYQFEKLEGRHDEAKLLAERSHMRLEGFSELVSRHSRSIPEQILEVGCAQGIRTQILARNYPNSQVIGVDRSDELLTTTSSIREPNLTFAHGNLYRLSYPDNHFDLVYARLVFMHLNEPLTAIAELRRVLKPGGTLLIEDADRDCMFFEPAPKSFAGFWQKVQEGQRRLGGDPNVGRKLAPYMKTLGFQNVITESQPIHGGREDILFLVRTLLPSLNVYLEPQDRQGGTAAIADLSALADNPAATFYHFWFVVSGQK